MNENTPTRNFWYMLALMVWLLALFCFALYKYDQSHNTGLQTYSKLQHELSTVQNESTSLGDQNDVLKATNTQLAEQKSQLCTELSKAKVADPLCTN